MPTEQSKLYTHGEAFMLMQYQCEKCQHVEMLWNSRDGVTPFGIDCLKCGEIMNHVNWRGDIRAPDFGDAIRSGEVKLRVFVDASPAHGHIQARAREYVEKYWDVVPRYGDCTMRETMEMSKEQAIDYFIAEWTKPGTPTILSADEYAKSPAI